MKAGASQAEDHSEAGESAWHPWERAALCAQAVLLLLAALQNLDALNTDAVAYIRIAGYWAEWNPELMISGYWGPLLSWKGPWDVTR